MQLTLAERLEAGEILRFQPCSVCPRHEEVEFLHRQRLQPSNGKYIRFAIDQEATRGAVHEPGHNSDRLTAFFRKYTANVQGWLANLLPRYAASWKPDQVTWRTEEEAIRRLSQVNRNDLLHVDVFPSRPTHGSRILRLFLNLHPTDTRVWATADGFASLLERFGETVGLPRRDSGWAWRWGQGLLSLFQTGGSSQSEYDRFMLRLHQALKSHEDYQEKAPRRLWHFQPGEAWLAFTDGLAHAELRGQFALEHSFFIPPHVLTRPELAPLTLLEKACGQPLAHRAA